VAPILDSTDVENVYQCRKFYWTVVIYANSSSLPPSLPPSLPSFLPSFLPPSLPLLLHVLNKYMLDLSSFLPSFLSFFFPSFLPPPFLYFFMLVINTC
jgi:hypothetical protein